MEDPYNYHASALLLQILLASSILLTFYINGVESSHEVFLHLQSVHAVHVNTDHRTGFHFQPQKHWINGTYHHPILFINLYYYYYILIIIYCYPLLFFLQKIMVPCNWHLECQYRHYGVQYTVIAYDVPII